MKEQVLTRLSGHSYCGDMRGAVWGRNTGVETTVYFLVAQVYRCVVRHLRSLGGEAFIAI